MSNEPRVIPREPVDTKKHGHHKTIEDCLHCGVCRPQARRFARELLKEKTIDEKTCIELENETDSHGVGYTMGNREYRRQFRKTIGKQVSISPVQASGSGETIKYRYKSLWRRDVTNRFTLGTWRGRTSHFTASTGARGDAR